MRFATDENFDGVLPQGAVDNSEGAVPSGRTSRAAAARRRLQTVQTGQERQV